MIKINFHDAIDLWEGVLKMAKPRLLEILDRKERVLIRRIDLIKKGHMTTRTNNRDDTLDTLDISELSLQEIREARSLLLLSPELPAAGKADPDPVAPRSAAGKTPIRRGKSKQ